MAFDAAPTSLWSGYTYDSENDALVIPLADLDGLTAAEANDTTGDWRSIMQSLLVTLYNHYEGLETADRPAAVSVATPAVQAVTTGDFAGKVKVTYSSSYYLALGDAVVADEPSA